MESLQDKLDEVCPTLIGITESHLLEEEDVKFDGYAEPCVSYLMKKKFCHVVNGRALSDKES